MVLKKEMASIGLIPIEANTAKGIQSKAVSKDTNSKYSKLVSNSQKTVFNSSIIDNFGQLFHIIIKGGSND
ncbi:hypothetical protein ACFOUP_16790 [Belliella kenyensis]|uniref:Uncharacterized protein n=1 Tax=Belliella kenyensis TaxID=1472724 RepID=A0ABV8ENZ5_9BACT|nr:hypothetical protein [Belliella kenyensis]MCH7402894.1 hypothetical protein [Belliella kenyensis]MDN3602600.1 hypothetical protein [Belliella kenyensis]